MVALAGAKFRTAGIFALMLGLSAAQGPVGQPNHQESGLTAPERGARARSTAQGSHRAPELSALNDTILDTNPTDRPRLNRLIEHEQLIDQVREAVDWANSRTNLHRVVSAGWLDLRERAHAGTGGWGFGSDAGMGLSGVFGASATRRDGFMAGMGSLRQPPVGGSVMPVSTASGGSRNFGFTPYSPQSGAPAGSDALGESGEGHRDGYPEGLRLASVHADVPAPATALLLAIGLLAGLSRRNCGIRFR